MNSVITDILQSASIIFLAIALILSIRRVNNLSATLNWKSTAIAQVREGRTTLEPQAVCGCGHHICFHDETGCGKIETWRRFDEEPHLQTCGCKRYTGPEPLPTVIP